MVTLYSYINEQLTNHLTPVSNIITMVQNLYAFPLHVTVEADEDGKGLLLKSSRFFTLKDASEIICTKMYNSISMCEYIVQQGLDKMEIVPVNAACNEWMVHFYANDLKKDKKECKCGKEGCKDCDCHNTDTDPMIQTSNQLKPTKLPLKQLSKTQEKPKPDTKKTK